MLIYLPNEQDPTSTFKLILTPTDIRIINPASNTYESIKFLFTMESPKLTVNSSNVKSLSFHFPSDLKLQSFQK